MLVFCNSPSDGLGDINPVAGDLGEQVRVFVRVLAVFNRPCLQASDNNPSGVVNVERVKNSHCLSELPYLPPTMLFFICHPSRMVKRMSPWGPILDFVTHVKMLAACPDAGHHVCRND